MKIVFVIGILIILINPISSFASSAGDDGGSPPPSGSSGGGGGSPNFYDYYVPLIFDETHRDGVSSITIWTIQPTLVITSFNLNDAGIQFIQLDEPAKLIFDPSNNIGLTNGSLIRTTSPVLIIGNRFTEDIEEDNSFAYSFLNDRMMGFEYISPINGWINIFSIAEDNIIQIMSTTGGTTSPTIPGGGETTQLIVKEGDYINSSFPMSAAFISYEEGTVASMALPKYLKGNEYSFDSDVFTLRENEIDRSYLAIIPSQATELTLYHDDGSIETKIIDRKIDIDLTKSLRRITSSRGFLTINLHLQTYYGGNLRSSLIQLMDSNEMRAGEIFVTPSQLSSYTATTKDETTYVSGFYDPTIGGFALSSRRVINRSRLQTVSYVGEKDIHILVGDEASFSYLSLPGKIGHPMSPSASFLNIPLNEVTTKPNVTGLKSTWYRFPNLAVTEISIVPGPPEEYTGQKVRVEIKSNGSLPASRFTFEISIDQEVVKEETRNFLQVNGTLAFEFTKFLSYGITKLSVTVRVDTSDEVNEINEDDNFDKLDIEINQNIRLRWSITGIIILIVIYLLYRLRRRIINRKKVSRTHVDAIISFEEEN